MANVYARIFHRPSFIPASVGSALLVPSSIGIRGLAQALISNESLSVVSFAMGLLITCVSMVVGG